MKKLVIEGSVPPKKNSRQLFVKNGRMINVPSSRYKEWETAALWQLKGKQPVTEYPIALNIIFTVKDKRSRDLDNMLASVMDCLQKAGIIESDDWQHCAPITIDCAGISKEPRCEVYIDEP